MVYTRKEAERFLTRAGWVIAPEYLNKDSYRRAVEDFQRGYTFSNLVPDGVVGALTSAAMSHSESLGYACSPNFKFKEFLCDCKGELVGCRSIRVDRELVRSLEKMRAELAPRTGIYIVSGYRCPTINKNVGGRTRPPSHHVTGKAVDILAKFTVKQIKPAWGFKGVGATRRDIKKPKLADRRVVHLDNGEHHYLPFPE